jgi:penicillin-binding protein 1C
MAYRRRTVFGLAVLVAAGLSVLAGRVGLDLLVDGTRPPSARLTTSAMVLDRNGRLLRPFPVAEGRWRLPLKLADLDPLFVRMLLAFEDRRFYAHHGVDPRALLRAAGQLILNGRIVSGASTISMQLVRLLEGGSTRSPAAKLRQILAALAIERRLGKDAILTAYLTKAPYGGNLEGVRSASLAWLGKEPKHLSPADAALLVALPQSPEARRPDRDRTAARRARDRVLERACAAGIISAAETAAARREPVPDRRRALPVLAPHAAARALRRNPRAPIHRLTMDANLQGRLEGLAAERAELTGPGVSAAILVADHTNGQILASVGSAGFFDHGRDGFIDMTRAVRSPGSTLKPLIYGLAFEDGIAHPASLIEDRPTGFAGYVPGNFDHEFHGTVTVREALQLSLNVPAIQLLDAVGPGRLLSRMRVAGAAPVLSDPSPPGLAIGLGGVGVTLKGLVRIYAAIARGGTALRLTEKLGAPAQSGEMRRILDERAAWYVASILAGAPTPANTTAVGLAFKTGTSYGYRDAWALGFDGRHVVGVWAGRPDGAPVPGLTGIEVAAPLLIDAFGYVGPPVPLRAPPPGVLAADSGSLPPPLRHVGGLRATPTSSASGPQIAFPPDGARVELARGPDGRSDLALKVRNGWPPFTWFANGTPIDHETFIRTAHWVSDGAGFATISVVDGRGESSRVTVFLEPD